METALERTARTGSGASYSDCIGVEKTHRQGGGANAGGQKGT